MEIIRGKLQKPQKVVVYGPEGIGKSTFASRFPDPLFIDTEGSTSNMDVARLKKPESWTMLLAQVLYVKSERPCKTLVIDTADWAERLCIEHICASHQKKGIEEFGYGNGYVYVQEEIGRFLNRLEDVIDAGIHVVLAAHAQIRKFDQPDEMGSYDRYELKLGKKTGSLTAPLIKEWADMVLFANYKTHSIAVDDRGKKHKAQGGVRVMYTTHHPCWDAKNRHDLPEELPFSYYEIQSVIEREQQSLKEAEPTKPKQEPQSKPAEATAAQPDPVPVESEQKPLEHQKETRPEEMKGPGAEVIPDLQISEGLPKKLKELMLTYQVNDWDIQTVVGQKGYYPEDTPIQNYDPGFIDGVLVGAWPQVYAMIEQLRKEVPFN